MKKYFSNIKYLLIIAFLLRFLFLPLTYHPDVNNHFWWGIYAQDFGFEGYYDFLNFGNYGRPEYPPFSIILFTLIKYIYDIIFNFLWQLNVAFPYFPSKLITWVDINGYKTLLKLPSIIADIGIGLIIYKWGIEKLNKKKALIATNLFLFNPAVIYVSALWGQIESIITFFALLSIYLLEKNRLYLATAALASSLLFKGTYLPLIAIFIVFAIKNKLDIYRLLKSVVLFSAIFITAAIPFTNSNPFVWMLEKYKDVFAAGAVILQNINVNAFNFWGATLGFEDIPVTTPFLFLTLGQIAMLISLILLAVIFYKYYKNNFSIILLSALLYFTIFTFFPKVHERYLYPAIVFLIFYIVTKIKNKFIFRLYVLLNFIFLINLYRLWWYPEIELFINLIQSDFVSRIFSISVVIIYILVLKTTLASDSQVKN